MATPIQHGSKAEELLDALSLKVRLLTVPQIARTWWPAAESLSSARDVLARLEREGLVRRFHVLSRPELSLETPVAVWTPGADVPNLGAVAYRLERRWALPARLIPAVAVTPKGANRFGGFARPLPRPSEQTHDVHLSAVYLKLRETEPHIAPSWISEAAIKKSRPDAPGEKLPDAMIWRNEFPTVIEFGGAYSKRKLSSFHAFCERRAYPYELW